MQALSINASCYAIGASGRKGDPARKREAGLNWSPSICGVRFGVRDMATHQIEEGVNKHNLRGAAIGGHANGDELSNPKFDPCSKKGEGAGWLVFMHTLGIEEMNQRLARQRRGLMSSAIRLRPRSCCGI